MYDQVSRGDEDLLGSNQNRAPRSIRITCNRRNSADPVTHHTLQTKMETIIHKIEKEAYYCVLRAFKCQADVITWEKNILMADLRIELKISDDEHTELLTKVDAHLTKQNEWCQPAVSNTAKPVPDDLPNSTVTSSSRKKQNTSQLFWHQHKTLPGKSSVKSMQSHSDIVSLVGKKVRIRCPQDSEFYEARVRMFNPAKGQHALVYDASKENATLEWVDLSQIPPEDIRWEGEEGRCSH